MNQSILIRLLLVLVACIALTQGSLAQRTYDRSVGLRLGYYGALSYKQFMNEAGAFELQLGSRAYCRRYRYTSFGAAYLHHVDMSALLEEWELPHVENLNYYLGGGISGYAWHARDAFYRNLDNHVSWGLELYAGLEYTLEDIPMVVSVDWSPRYFFGNNYGYYSRLGWGYGAVTVRYVLK